MAYVKNVIVDHFEKWFNDNTFIDEKHTEVLKTLFFYLRHLNVWPKHGQNLHLFNMPLLIFLLFPITMIVCLAEIIHIFSTKRNYLLDDVLTGAAMVATAFYIYILVTSFIQNNNKIRLFAYAIGDFSIYPKPKNFDKVNKRMNSMSHVVVIYSVYGVLFYAFLGFLNRSACLKEAEELNLAKICGMIAPGLYPASFNSSPNFYIGFINQIYTSTAGSVIGLLILFLLFGMTEMLITRIQDFKEALKKPFLIQNHSERKQYLNYCIRYHYYILELAEQLNDSMSTIAFIMATFTSGLLALIGFQFMMKPELKSSLHIVAYLTMLALLTLAGQRLIDESSEITDVIWATDWFDGNIEAQKYVLMIILRSNNPIYIDWHFGQISFETFTSVMSTSYSILNLLSDAHQ